MYFIDEAKIYLKAGDGGNGCVAFRREKFIEHGGPNGGDGGKGGNIIFVSTHHINTLVDFRYKQHFKAKNGEGGKGSNMYGRSADDIIIEVPIGTQIFDESGDKLLYDFDKDDMRVVFLRGGDGGLGNSHFKSSTNQAPRRATKGHLGEESWVWLKLKLLCDVGLVGLPNAGKSTFLSVATTAKPKIADYPFTTLKPQLGVAYVDDSEIVVADLPGLIEGASSGQGLGDRFLKHVERCKVILHLIDITTDVSASYKLIRNELALYNEDILAKQEILVLTKADLLEQDLILKVVNEFEMEFGIRPYVVSSATKTNVLEVLRVCKAVLQDSISA